VLAAGDAQPSCQLYQELDFWQVLEPASCMQDTAIKRFMFCNAVPDGTQYAAYGPASVTLDTSKTIAELGLGPQDVVFLDWQTKEKQPTAETAATGMWSCSVVLHDSHISYVTSHTV